MIFKYFCILLLTCSLPECKSNVVYAGLMVEGISPEKISPLLHAHSLIPKVSSYTSRTLFKSAENFVFKLLDSRQTQDLALSRSAGAQALAVVIRGDHHSYFSYTNPDTGQKLFKHFYIIPMTGLVYRFTKNGNVIQKSYPVLAKSVYLLETTEFNPEHLYSAYQSGLKKLILDLQEFPPNQRNTTLHTAGKNRFRVDLGVKDGVLEGTIVSLDANTKLKVQEVGESKSYLTHLQGRVAPGALVSIPVDNVELPTAIFSIYPIMNDTLKKWFGGPEQKLQITQWATEILNRHVNYRVLPPELKDGFRLVSVETPVVTDPISAAGMAHEVIQSAYSNSVHEVEFSPLNADVEFFIKLSGLDSFDMTSKLKGLSRTGSRLVAMKVWGAIRHQGKDYEGTASSQIKILKNQSVDPRPVLMDLVYEAIENAVKTYQKEN